jgi:hypothetical protein
MIPAGEEFPHCENCGEECDFLISDKGIAADGVCKDCWLELKFPEQQAHI